MTPPPTERGARDSRRNRRDAEARSGARFGRNPESRARAGAPPPPAPPAIDPAIAERGAFALGAMLALLAAARAAAAFAPGMQAWGLDALRFVAPVFGWPLWALAAAALIPSLSRPLAATLAAAGESLAARPVAAMLAFAAACALLVGTLPDRLWLVGDFLLRLGCTRGSMPVAIVFPQALPLDLLVHHHVAVALAARFGIDPNEWERALGALEAAAFGACAVAFARELGLRGVAAIVCASAVAFTGLLAMFTGYGKGFVELTLLTVAAAVFALQVARGGGGAWALALVIALALGFHRSALTLFVPLGVTAWFAARARNGRDSAGRGVTLAVLAIPVVVAAALATRIVAAMQVTDARHLAPTGANPLAILAAAFAPAHLRETLNLVAESAPLAFAAPVIALAMAPALRARRREWSVLAAFVAPALLVLLFVHPRQGEFRDRDVFAPSLAALALASAALAGEALRGAPSRAWLGVAAVLGTLVPAVQTLALTSDVDRGLARVRAYVAEVPPRPDEERALLWTYLAERNVALTRGEAASDAFAHAAELAPSARILTEWALAEQDRHRFAVARDVFYRVTTRYPTFTEGWLGLADNLLELDDLKAARAAAEHARALEPGRPEAPAMLAEIARRDSVHVAR